MYPTLRNGEELKSTLLRKETMEPAPGSFQGKEVSQLVLNIDKKQALKIAAIALLVVGIAAMLIGTIVLPLTLSPILGPGLSAGISIAVAYGGFGIAFLGGFLYSKARALCDLPVIFCDTYPAEGSYVPPSPYPGEEGTTP